MVLNEERIFKLNILRDFTFETVENVKHCSVLECVDLSSFTNPLFSYPQRKRLHPFRTLYSIKPIKF